MCLSSPTQGIEKFRRFFNNDFVWIDSYWNHKTFQWNPNFVSIAIENMTGSMSIDYMV